MSEDPKQQQPEEEQQLPPQPMQQEESEARPISKGPQQHQHANNYHGKKRKQTFSRIPVDPSKRYTVPVTRESWGPGCKGKKFRKEKGKKKRCGSSGQRIDGSIKSVRLDARQ